jgi:hypothetical protein
VRALDTLFSKMTARAPRCAPNCAAGRSGAAAAAWEDDLLHIGQEILTERAAAVRQPNAFTAQMLLPRTRAPRFP